MRSRRASEKAHRRAPPAAPPDAPGPANGDSSDAAYAAGRPADDEALRGLCEFLRGSRLNLNVREVGD